MPRWVLPVSAILLLAALAVWLLAGSRGDDVGRGPAAAATVDVGPDAAGPTAGAGGAAPSAAPGAAPWSLSGEIVSDETAARPPEAPKVPEPPPANEEWLRLPDRPIPKELVGTVVDGETGQPVPSARILLAVGRRESGVFGSWGETGDRSGRFAMRPQELIGPTHAKPEEREAALRSLRAELRIRVPGYAVWRGPAEEAVYARLDPLPRPVAPGTVEGVVTTSDGSPFEGRIAVEGMDRDFGDWMSQWTTAEAGGRYRLEGIPAGWWRLWAVENPDGGCAIEVPSGGTVALDLAFSRFYTGAGDLIGSLAPATRRVLVTDLPPDAGPECAVRAELLPRQFFRTLVRDGQAGFDALPLGTWTIVLQRDGFADTSFRAEVPAGDGILTLRWSGP